MTEFTTYHYQAEFFEDFASTKDTLTEELLSAIEQNTNAGKWTRVPDDHPVELITENDEDEGVKTYIVLGEELHHVRAYCDERDQQWLREPSED